MGKNLARAPRAAAIGPTDERRKAIVNGLAVGKLSRDFATVPLNWKIKLRIIEDMKQAAVEHGDSYWLPTEGKMMGIVLGRVLINRGW